MQDGEHVKMFAIFYACNLLNRKQIGNQQQDRNNVSNREQEHEERCEFKLN